MSCVPELISSERYAAFIWYASNSCAALYDSNDDVLLFSKHVVRLAEWEEALNEGCLEAIFKDAVLFGNVTLQIRLAACDFAQEINDEALQILKKMPSLRK